MPEKAIIPDGAAPDPEVFPETAKAKFERERLSRRQALKRLGMTSAMTAFALFSVDDLAHMVGKTMQQRAADNKVATQVAKELQQAGVVLADTPQSCTDCCRHFANVSYNNTQLWCGCMDAVITPTDVDQCMADDKARQNNALYDYGGCFSAHCIPQGLHCPPLQDSPCVHALPGPI